MAIKVNCIMCDKKLKKPGAILFGVPFDSLVKNVSGASKKHICDKCIVYLDNFIESFNINYIRNNNGI